MNDIEKLTSLWKRYLDQELSPEEHAAQGLKIIQEGKTDIDVGEYTVEDLVPVMRLIRAKNKSNKQLLKELVNDSIERLDNFNYREVLDTLSEYRNMVEKYKGRNPIAEGDVAYTIKYTEYAKINPEYACNSLVGLSKKIEGLIGASLRQSLSSRDPEKYLNRLQSITVKDEKSGFVWSSKYAAIVREDPELKFVDSFTRRDVRVGEIKIPTREEVEKFRVSLERTGVQILALEDKGKEYAALLRDFYNSIDDLKIDDNTLHAYNMVIDGIEQVAIDTARLITTHTRGLIESQKLFWDDMMT